MGQVLSIKALALLDIARKNYVVHGLEQRVPEALAADKKMADMFRRKVGRTRYGANQKA